MHQPPQDIYTALYRAALSSGVPLSLLEALAFVLSGYRADAQSELPKANAAHAAGRGLFLLSPAACAALGVKDATDPTDNARAAGVLLARLKRDYHGDPQSMVVGFIFGRKATAAVVAAKEPVPAEVRDMLDRVLSARVWLQERAEPNGASTRDWPPADSQAAQLDNAILGLAAANPSYEPAQALARRWGPWRDAQRRDSTLRTMVSGPQLVKWWELYDAAYAGAPITDGRTPLPASIRPRSATPTVEAGQRALAAALPTLPQGWLTQGWAAFAAVALLVSLATLGSSSGRRG